MTKEQTREAAKVMLAWADGQSIDRKDLAGRVGYLPYASPETKNIIWDWDRYDYRIKPQPTYRPYKTAEELFDDMAEYGEWVKDGNTYRRIEKITEQGTGIAITLSGCKEWGINELPRFAQLTWRCGEPFGKMEE